MPHVRRLRCGRHRRRGSNTGASRCIAASRAIVVFFVASSLACSSRSRAKVRRSFDDQVRPKSRLVAATASGDRCRHLLEEPGRGDERLVVHLAGQPELDGPLPADHLTGHRQPLRDVHPHLLRQGLDAAHVRDEPPAGLHDRPLGVGGGHPQVGGQRDLQPTAVAVAVHRRHDRHRHPAPGPAGLLEQVGATPRVRHERARHPRRVLQHRREVEPGAERLALATDHHPAQGAVAGQVPGGGHEVLERVEGQRVELVWAVEPDLGDAALDPARDGARHATTLRMPGAGRRAQVTFATMSASGCAPTGRRGAGSRARGGRGGARAPTRRGCRGPRTARPTPTHEGAV